MAVGNSNAISNQLKSTENIGQRKYYYRTYLGILSGSDSI